MERHAFAMKIKDGKMNDYRRKLGEIWQELTVFLDRNEVGNFSIWNAGGYIFGYDEIDTTMEVEVRQLGIMDWITNDVDWMTGEVHADVKRLAWHN